jgi:hypothetical protein
MRRVRAAPEMPAELARLHPDPWTEPFWSAAREHRLVAPRCRRCGAFRMPPAPFCWKCRSQAVDWVALSGRGTVFTFNVTRQALIPQLRPAIPYVVAVVELEGAPGVRLISNVIDVDPARVRIGLPVRVAWDDIDEETTIPRFVPADASA